ncbi:AIPR family protein [Amycolatopsis sp. WQ 127309]|uniref:AIPR family protein n=1 Tax=Amycolatopsis sp. WQ 127309 TaxID=2932773 RepID=UPI001FF6349D|nr:AIPR family protein [Amycolatopsis sp. WQ 127309]UOZ03188.1 AIPR family protein [Amycolatopsis sp. WQ 127309]
MHTLTSKRVVKFSRNFGFGGTEAEQFERYVAANYLFQYVGDDVELIERSVLGGGSDEGIDIAAVVVNGRIVFEPEEIDELIAEQGANSAKVIFIQAKTSESYDSKLIAKFLHGVEAVTKYAMKPKSLKLPPRLVDVAILIDRIAESGDKFQDSRIPCELYYVTTSSNDGRSAQAELQVTEAIGRIREIGAYSEDFKLRTHGYEELAAKQKERHGPQNVQFNFEKRQTIPATDRVSEAYIGLVSASELLKLLKDDSGDVRSGIFDDNVRLDLGAQNSVNSRIMGTLRSAEREHFPFLNNGLTIIATELRGLGDRFFISGYQIVNGGQTSHQLIRWAETEEVKNFPQLMLDLWVPVKIVSSNDSGVRTSVSIATNLQTAIGSSDIQASSQVAKNVEEYFAQSGADGLRYERQNRGAALEFARTRVVTTPELNRAVAATLFGESSRAIGSPKDLEVEDAFVWGERPEETYYYAAWIIYRIDRYFARTPESTTLKAAKYHLSMMASALVNPELIPLFEAGDIDAVASRLARPKRLSFRVVEKKFSDEIEGAIALAAELTADLFRTVLSEGRSLRKDDVRSRKSQEALLQKVKALNKN